MKFIRLNTIEKCANLEDCYFLDPTARNVFVLVGLQSSMIFNPIFVSTWDDMSFYFRTKDDGYVLLTKKEILESWFANHKPSAIGDVHHD